MQERIWLKKARRDARYTQKDMAAAVGVSKSHYEKIEYGEKNPSVALAKKIARVLSFSWVCFFTDETKEA